MRTSPFKRGKSKVCCDKDPRFLLVNRIYELYPEFRINVDI